MNFVIFKSISEMRKKKTELEQKLSKINYQINLSEEEKMMML